MKKDEDFQKKLWKEVDKIVHKKSLEIAKQIIKDVSNEIHNVIEDFYNYKFDEFYGAIPTGRHENGSHEKFQKEWIAVGAKEFSDYQPWVYQRRYGMEDMYRVSLKKTEYGHSVEFTFAPEYETAHHTAWHGTQEVADASVFELDFIRGWHGGWRRTKTGWNLRARIRQDINDAPYYRIKDYVKAYKLPKKFTGFNNTFYGGR